MEKHARDYENQALHPKEHVGWNQRGVEASTRVEPGTKKEGIYHADYRFKPV